MPSFQFCMYEIGIRRSHKKESHQVLSQFNSRAHDFADVIHKFLDTEVGTKGMTLKKGEHYIRLMKSEKDERIIWATVESGRFGNTGKVVDVATGDDTYDMRSEDAPTYPVRQCFIIPRSGSSAIWATEVIGNSSAITSLWTPFYDWFRERYANERLTIERSPLQNTDAWNAFLEAAQLQEIKFLAYVEDSDGAVGVKRQEFSAKSGRGMRLPKEWITRAYARELPPSTVFHVQGLPEPDEVHLEIEREGKSRTVVVGQEFPRFLYPLESHDGSRPDDSIFRNEVLSEAGASLDLMQVSRGDWQD